MENHKRYWRSSRWEPNCGHLIMRVNVPSLSIRALIATVLDLGSSTSEPSNGSVSIFHAETGGRIAFVRPENSLRV